MGCLMGRKQPNTSLTGSPLTQLQPHPRPLSEWRGEWILLVGCERMISGNRGNCILKLRKRPSRLQKGVSSLWREPLFNLTRRPLYLQIMVFTPLSIRRGVGGEAFLYLQTAVFTPLSITSLRSVTAGSERGRGFPLFANNGFHSPLHYFPSVSDRWFGEEERHFLICKQ